MTTRNQNSSSVKSCYPIYRLEPNNSFARVSKAITSQLDMPEREIKQIGEILNLFPAPFTCDELYNFEITNLDKEKDGQTKRPPNCYILFRKSATMQAKIKGINQKDQRYWSRVTAKLWKLASAEDKAQYKTLSKAVGAKHSRINPTYKFKPKRAKASWKNFVSNISKKIPQQLRNQENALVKTQIEGTESSVPTLPENSNFYFNYEYIPSSFQNDSLMTNILSCHQPEFLQFFSYTDSNF
ncbi:hypothetical protein G9A89_008927 [Geosiphon pyriformis]|nr:hypothetical protein G9A89_008927 [Geosiphon pyriformis]